MIALQSILADQTLNVITQNGRQWYIHSLYNNTFGGSLPVAKIPQNPVNHEGSLKPEWYIYNCRVYFGCKALPPVACNMT